MALPLIKVVQLTLTNRCQCNCKHCGVSKLREVIKGELTVEQIDLLFQDLKLAGCLVVDLFGGEPTLRHDLFDIIARGKSYGFVMSLETNGYVIDHAYMNRLVAAGLDQIYLSLDDYRAEAHDGIRRKSGSFDRAVRALELGAKTDIMMHVSTVPQTRDFFLNGDINRFMQFVLDHGAEKVRLLLPRFVGDSIREDSGPVCAGEERELFSHVSAAYYDYIYLHTPGTRLTEKNICTAKQVFCHVMSNGWVAPCPYFPLVFGDAIREPIIDIFERIQAHPLVRLGGDYCPMRNEEYINTHIRGLGLDRPFFPIIVGNQIDLGSACRAGCPDCAYGARPIPRPADEIVREIGEVASEYTRIEFYGGDAFLRDDLFTILGRVPRPMKMTLWSTYGQVPQSVPFVKRIRSYPIEAVKVHFSGSFTGDTARSDLAAALEEALRRVSFLCSWGLPIHLYVPMDLMAQFQALFAARIRELGVERLYTFTRDLDRPLVNSVACFGN
ncbi:MAG: radical SAM protein [Syntrophales bacterium LBB04]|nr:radical SAM protein [Syntrophales bacterium LBB04]